MNGTIVNTDRPQNNSEVITLQSSPKSKNKCKNQSSNQRKEHKLEEKLIKRQELVLDA